MHDAARPLLLTEVIERVLEPLGEGWDGVVPALPIADTIKRVERDVVAQTVPRTASWRRRRLRRSAPTCWRAALAGDTEVASDCASLVEARGGRVKVVAGDPRL